MPVPFDEVYRRSLERPVEFWGEAARAVLWDRVLDDSRPPFYWWFPGGVVNTCHNALDRHIDAGNGDRIALIYDSPVTGTVQSITYRELQVRVARCAGGLRTLGVGKGDPVVIYMPMVPEAAIAILACARIGAIHPVVFGGFASPELASRIQDARPKVILSDSFKQAVIVKRLPKTRSGKILRGTMKKIADGEPHRVPPTIDDPAILEEIRESLRALGYAKK